MKKILVPTDFSLTAEKAFRFAVNLATKCNGQVILYHVYTPAESTFIATDEKRQVYNTQLEKETLHRLEQLKKNVAAEATTVPVETIVGRPPLTRNLLQVAEQYAIDLIVMGTQGASGLKKVIIGCETSRIAEESEIPVLLIPEKMKGFNPEKLVFASDYAPSDSNALQLSISLAQMYEASLTVIHLFAPSANKTSEEKEIAVFETFSSQLQKSFAPFPLQFKPVRTASVKDTMENLNEVLPYDMLVMVRKNKSFLQRLFLESFTKEMCCVTSYPLLVVPADYTFNKEQSMPSTSHHETIHHSI